MDTSRILPQLEHDESELFDISEPQQQDLSTDTVGAPISVFSLCECGVFSLTFDGNKNDQKQARTYLVKVIYLFFFVTTNSSFTGQGCRICIC